MSILFITEPKHAPPMAVSTLMRCAQSVWDCFPLEVLFAPIEVVFSHGRSLFRVSSAPNSLGALLASANNQRVVLDPSVKETRLIKEKSMPITELSLTQCLPLFSVGLRQGLEQLTQEVVWGGQAETQQAAFFFPFIKCVTLRTLLRDADW